MIVPDNLKIKVADFSVLEYIQIINLKKVCRI